ncbi:MAG: OmpA family protein [Waddliaceae bacterium]
MGKWSLKFGVMAVLLATIMSGCCNRNSSEVWDDTRTASRHVARGFKSLGGKHGDSRAVCCRDDFVGFQGDFYEEDLGFIPLEDYQGNTHVAMNDRPYYSNEFSSTTEIPGVDGFKNPKDIPGLNGVFAPVRFPHNSTLIKGDENRNIMRGIASYLNQNPNTYVFIEGHCDERGAEAYNLALGSRRSNAVRNELVKLGANQDRLYTVSYGKEKPVVLGHTEDAWAQNRRAEFKIHQK